MAGVSAPLVIQHQTGSRLRKELAVLRQRNAELERWRLESQSGAASSLDEQAVRQRQQEREELLRLRAEVGSLRSPVSNLAGARSGTAGEKPPASGSEEPRVPAASWANVGLATPRTALQTLSWAKANRETGTLVNALAWVDEQTRASIEGLFAAAPEAVRAQYGSAGGFILSVVAEPWTRSGPMKRVPGHLRVARSRLHAGFMANTESDNLEVTRSGVRGKIHGRMNHEQPIAAVTALPTQLVREQGPRWCGGCAGSPGEP